MPGQNSNGKSNGMKIWVRIIIYLIVCLGMQGSYWLISDYHSYEPYLSSLISYICGVLLGVALLYRKQNEHKN
jgi:hypothetical protein